MITVYALVDPRDNSYRYVGRTSNMKFRFVKHRSVGTNKGTPKNEWIRELRGQGLLPKLEILEEGLTKEEGGFWERYYTDLFRSWGFDLLNNRYYKFGNQTSFKIGENYRPVVAITKKGEYFKTFPSIKSVYAEYGKVCVPQCLMGIKKSAADMLWFYEEDYLKKTPEEIMAKVEWAKPKRNKFN